MRLPSILRFGLAVTLLCFGHLLTARTQTKTGTISGRITIGGKPAQGVSVTALPAQRNVSAEKPQVLAQAKTDAEGQYRLTGLPAGNFKITVTAREYVNADGDWHALPPGRGVMLGEGEQLDNHDFALVRGGVITGRVTSAAGKPLIEEAVTIFRLDEKGKKESFNAQIMLDLKTDDRGVYRVYGLPPGRYLVAAGFDDSSPQYGSILRRGYPLTYYPGTTDEAQAKVIEATPGSEATEVDIKFGERARGHDVIVRVVEAETGRPVPNQFVSYVRARPDSKSAWPTGRGAAATDNKGETRLEMVSPGRYLAMLSRPDKSEFYAEPVPFEVTGAGADRVEVPVRRGAVLSGVVVLEGVRDPALLAQVKQLSLRVAQTGRPAVTAPFSGVVLLTSDLSFRTSALPPGKYQLWTWGDGMMIVRIEHNGKPLPNSFEFSGGEQLDGLRVVLSYSDAVVRGQVQIIGGALPANARLMVNARYKDSTLPFPFGRSAEVDSRGRFVLEHLSAGTYEVTLVLSLPPGTPRANLPPVFRRPPIKHEIVVGNTGETQLALTLDLSPQEERR